MALRPATMFRTSQRVVDLALRAFDLIALTASFPIAYLIRDRILGERYINHPGLYPIDQYWSLILATLPSWIGASWWLHLYSSDRIRSVAGELYRVMQAVITVAVTVAAVWYLTKQVAVSRLFVCLYFISSMIVLAANRFLLRSALRVLHRRGHCKRIVAIVGTGETARDIAAAIVTRGEWGYHSAGYIRAESEPGPSRAGPLIGSLSRLERILDNRVLDEIVFAVPQEPLAGIEAAARLCTDRGVTARVCLQQFRHGRAQLSLDELSGFPLLDFH